MTDAGPPSALMSRRIALLAIGTAGLLSGAFMAWSLTCPCERTPGGYLIGPGPGEPIADWSFANDVTLCQIQVRAGPLPYSINLNCMATGTGELYLSCGRCEGKRWGNAVLDDGTIRMRLDEIVYPVTVTRVRDPDELDRAWGARVAKLQLHGSDSNPAVPAGTPRPDGWWSFRVESR